MFFQQPQQKIGLKKGSLTCEVWPKVGGSIASLDMKKDKNIHLLRPTPLQDRYTIADMACFPLVPYSNRIKNGAFVFEGRRICIPRGPNDLEHALHGHGWCNPWTVQEQKQDRVRMSFNRVEDDAWPFSYRAEQEVTLNENGLDIVLSLKNTGTGNMPAGLGLHPYFPKPRDTTLQAPVQGVWLTTPDVIPTERIKVPSNWDINAGLALDTPVLDNCFVGWSGRAQLTWPQLEKTLNISSDVAKNLVIYCPKDKNFVCVEPVTNIIDAHNRINLGEVDTGLVSLRPNEKISMGMRLEL